MIHGRDRGLPGPRGLWGIRNDVRPVNGCFTCCSLVNFPAEADVESIDVFVSVKRRRDRKSVV